VPFFFYDLTGLGLTFSRNRNTMPCDLLEHARDKEGGNKSPLLFSFADRDVTKRLYVSTTQPGLAHKLDTWSTSIPHI
jgi:hypothetical protein